MKVPAQLLAPQMEAIWLGFGELAVAASPRKDFVCQTSGIAMDIRPGRAWHPRYSHLVVSLPITEPKIAIVVGGPDDLLPLNLVQDVFRHGPGNSAKERRAKRARHSANRARYQPNNPFHQLSHHAVARAFTFRGLFL
jgi:hypothetical protein